MCNFADDTTCYACDMDVNFFIRRLKHGYLSGIEWLENNDMKLSQDKCHLLVSEHKNENVWAHIVKEKIWESNQQKLQRFSYR